MKLTIDQRWDLIDKIAKQTVTFGEYRHTLKDAIGELTIKPLTGIPIAIAVMYAFWSIFGSFAGTLFTDGFMVKLFDGHFLPWMQDVFPGAGGWLYYIIVGDPLADNSFEAFGMLTSGLFVAIGVVLPAIFIFYLMLALLEDIGYMPRLAVLIDTVLHKIGLHGYAIVPTILSLGCNVPGVTATRILETKKQRFIMMTLLAIFIPCGAQIGIMEEVIPDTMGWVLLYLITGYFIFGYILNKIVPGKSPEFLIDVPPYRKPMISNLSKKVWGRIAGFFKVALPFVLLGCGIVNVLYLADEVDDKFNHHRTSQHENPRYSEDDEERNIKQYGGEEGEDYIHIVLGRHGSPTFAVFDRRLMKIDTYPVYKIKASGIDESYTEIINKLALIPPLPENVDITIMGIDTGYTEPTAIVIMYEKKGIIRIHARIRLTKVEYHIQEKLIDLVNDFEHVFTVEDNVLNGGFGATLEINSTMKITKIALPNQFIEHGAVDELYKRYNMDAVSIANTVISNIEGR